MMPLHPPGPSAAASAVAPPRPARRRRGPRRGAAAVLAAILAAVLAVPWLAACSGAVDAAEDGPAGGGLEARRGSFQRVQLLTGELRAERAIDLVVPKLPSWQVQLSWMVEDGAEVAAGDPVIEFDSSQFTSDLDEKRLQLREKENELERLAAEGEVETLEKRYAIEQRRVELAKAASKADVPPELMAEADYQELQLAQRNAELELAKAEADLEAAEAARGAEMAMKEIEIETARRDIQQAESAVESMAVTAPQAGIFVVQDHMWEPRKLKQGDMVHRGHTVARLPELSSMRVEAELSDVDDGLVEPGMRGECVLDAYPQRVFPCRVTAVSPVARESKSNSLLRSFQVRLELLEDDPSVMRPGMSVKAAVTTHDLEDVTVAPRAALLASDNPQRAFLRGGGDTEVELGACNALACVVESGLADGDRLARVPATQGLGVPAVGDPAGVAVADEGTGGEPAEAESGGAG